MKLRLAVCCLLISLFALPLAAQMSSSPAAQRPAPLPPTAEEAALNAEFAKLGHDWMMALQREDYVALEKFLAPEYALIVSSEPTRVIARKAWLENSRMYKVHEFFQSGLVARRVGETVVTSFVHKQKATVGPNKVDRSADFWIVDVWRKVDGAWKVASRYSGKVEEAARSASATTPAVAATPAQATPATLAAPPVDEDVRAGRKLNNEGKQDEAIALYRKVLAEKPDSYDAHISLGIALDLKGEYAEARKHLQRAIDLAPERSRAQALRTMAMSYAFESNSKAAEKYHQQVFDERTKAGNHAGAAEIANEIARVCLESGDISAAERWYKAGYESASRATELKETERALWLFRWEHAKARIAARRGQKADAARHAAAARAALDKANNKDQEPYYPYLLGYIAFYNGDMKTAIAELEKSNQEDPFILVLLAQAHEKQGNAAKATDYYQKVMKANNHNPTNAFARPIARKKLGK